MHNLYNDTILGSAIAKMIYGETIHRHHWIDYAKALMCIAGADGVISEEEMKWLLNDFMSILDASQEHRDELMKFDYHSANLTELLNNLSGGMPINFRRALIYDAVRMSRADNDYSPIERAAVELAAELLGVPLYLAKTIEGLVSTEISLDATRRSIFEAPPILTAEQPLTPKWRKAGIVYRKVFGVEYINEEFDELYCQALIKIAGADGVVSQPEYDWLFEEYVNLTAIPPHIVERLRKFDYKNADLNAILEKLKEFMHINLSKALLYDSIKMARTDKLAWEESDAVVKAAQILQVDMEIAKTLVYLIDAEEKISKMRKTLFRLSN